MLKILLDTIKKLTPYFQTQQRQQRQDNEHEFGGLKARSQYLKKRKSVGVFGLLHWDLVNLDHLLVSGLPLKMVLHRQRDSFVLMADDAIRDCRDRIIEAQLCI